jgi:2,3-bisphosphoglycerate-dependent phosphoglycerate mutase
MTTLILARHGETDWNRENRFQGHADPPLNALGRQQSGELAEALAGDEIVRVYTSPLRRARETAEIVAARLTLEVEPVEGLREIDVGAWSGLTRTEVEQRFPQAYARWVDRAPHGFEDGETYDELAARVIPALRRLAERHPSDAVLVVTHGGPSRVMQAHAAGIDYAEARRRETVLANCAVCRFAVEDGNFRRLG